MDIVWLSIGTGFFVLAGVCVHWLSRLNPEV